MQDLFPVPSCFSSSISNNTLFSSSSSSSSFPSPKLAQNLVILIYRTKTGGHFTLITITWCRNLLTRGLSISINGDNQTNSCKVEMRPWHFWRRHGSKRFTIQGNKPVDVIWDLRNAKFCDEDNSSSPEPLSDYYVAIVSDNEVVLLLGDLKKEAYRRTGSPPAVIEAMLVSKKEHVFGKKRFVTRAKFDEKGRFHEVSIECEISSSVMNMESEMVIKIDGMEVVHVRHLQWKFRGNEMISLSKVKLEVYWDVHGWLFSPASGLRHALFIFKPSSSSSSSSSSSLSSLMGGNGCSSYSDFCLFLNAWKVE
ncbi:hypothetical protein M5K25_002066 [Dendrobium thyrsiflorum]|uniref:DUF868 family protein n=1 Tax=Dendrobium thyrsiflorum TaxID=117978 RepID=A0ABD0W0Z5_DENTH